MCLDKAFAESLVQVTSKTVTAALGNVQIVGPNERRLAIRFFVQGTSPTNTAAIFPGPLAAATAGWPICPGSANGINDLGFDIRKDGGNVQKEWTFFGAGAVSGTIFAMETIAAKDISEYL